MVSLSWYILLRMWRRWPSMTSIRKLQSSLNRSILGRWWRKWCSLGRRIRQWAPRHQQVVETQSCQIRKDQTIIQVCVYRQRHFRLVVWTPIKSANLHQRAREERWRGRRLKMNIRSRRPTSFLMDLVSSKYQWRSQTTWNKQRTAWARA